MQNGDYATKQDLIAVRDELKADISTAREEMKAMEERLREYVQDMETKLLRAFYAFAESNQKHLADLERSDLGMRERLTALETRMTEVEKRLNVPPS